MGVPKNKPSPRRSTSLLRGLFLVFLLVLIYVILNALADNPAQKIDLEKISGPISNPLMGWAPWATIKESNQPHTLVYADLTWRDFEPQEGYFDFDTFEQVQQLTRWRQEGKRVVFRFVVDRPGDETHLDIPDWLFDKMDGRGDFYDNSYGKGFSPDYSNPAFIEYHQKVITALEQRYAKDPFFAFIELGSLGHWGEWHTHPDITSLPSQTVRDTFVYQYMEAFPQTYLLMRRPFSIAQTLGLGLYNDMTADLAQTTTWLDWIENGGEYLPDEPAGLSPMPDGWQKAPIGGEQSPVLSNEQAFGTDLEQTVGLLRKSHTTFIGPNGPYNVEPGSPLQAGVDKVLATIGYRIYIDSVQMPQHIKYGKSFPITLTFSNDGIAPMYYNWPKRVYLFDESGHTVIQQEIQMDLRKILPGEIYDVTFEMHIDGLENGIYTIGIAIIDPLTGTPAIRFANKNKRNDLIQYLGSFEIRRRFRLRFPFELN